MTEGCYRIYIIRTILVGHNDYSGNGYLNLCRSCK